jgi:1,4-alpha-glucan branching enzyme
MLKMSLFNQFLEGHCLDAYKIFGAHFAYEGVSGVRFTVFAPHAKSIQVIGDFNNWQGHDYHLEKLSDHGIWSLFVPNIIEWSLYKYLIEDAQGQFVEKSDPFAFSSEMRPKFASLVVNLRDFGWEDSMWMKNRKKTFDQPMNIYEVHLGSWKRKFSHAWMNYEELGRHLIPYVKEQGYTHIELLPLHEYPFDGSWGYQPTGYFSVTARYGTPKQLMAFINECHMHDIGVILDFVLVHFVRDIHGLAQFDGTPLYEYPRPADANSPWGTLMFNLWKEEVRSFLMSAASFYFDVYHIDGMRFDAVANILFWQGDKNRGFNDGAIAFLRRMNHHLSERYPDVILIAEDSSDFTNVTKPTFDLGLGFDYKWDLGWMNDTLKYYALDPVYRKYHHHQLTFSMAYFYAEKFILPLSHDEVVHSKGTILNKMWGSYEQKFAQARNLYAYMYAHPGKKLMFMGNELGHFSEWDEDKELDWHLLNYTSHHSFARFIKDLNHIYLHHACLSRYDYDYRGFKWIDADNANQSIYSFLREDEKSIIVVVLNMTPASYEDFELGVPIEGEYLELINSEKDIYDGCNMCNFEPLIAYEQSNHRFDYTINIRIAPFAAIYFEVCKN